MNEKKSRILKTLKEYLIILLGGLIYALAFDWLFEPNNIVMGGFTGLAQSLNHFIPSLPIGLTVAIMNVPLFIIGFKLQGPKLLWSSLFAMLTSSAAIDILPKFIEFKPMDDLLMVCILGGAMLGTGLGMQLQMGATTGGTELAAALLKYKFKHIQIGKLCLYIDLIVIAIYTLTFQYFRGALYAAIAMYVNSAAMDAFIYGRKTSKVACIVCSGGEELMKKLLEMDFGITEITAKGGYSGQDRTVLICAFKPSRIAAIKKAVVELDPKAFIMICDAQEVYGEGFAECMLNSL